MKTHRASDARAYRIEATARARKELPHVRRALEESFEPPLRQLSAADRRQLQESIARLTEIFEREE